jgi:hypothetical protein
MVVPLIIVGLAAVAHGVSRVGRAVPKLRARHSVIRAPAAPIARMVAMPLAKIRGRVCLLEQGSMPAPCSGRSGVLVRTVISEYRSRGRTNRWIRISDRTDSVAFGVDDGSGEVARVVPGQSRLIAPLVTIFESNHVQEIPLRVSELLRARDIRTVRWTGFQRTLRVEEHVLAVGDEVSVIGATRRIAGPPTPDGYRERPGTELELLAPTEPGGALIITPMSERDCAQRLLWPFVRAAACSAFGLALLLLSVLLR